MKFSPAGTPITLQLRRREDCAVFSVRDHGPGLREEDLPHLFNSFHRGRGTEGIHGTGLAIVKRTVESLGGSVTAQNSTDGGALFTVELPVFVTHA